MTGVVDVRVTEGQRNRKKQRDREIEGQRDKGSVKQCERETKGRRNREGQMDRWT